MICSCLLIVQFWKHSTSRLKIGNWAGTCLFQDSDLWCSAICSWFDLRQRLFLRRGCAWGWVHRMPRHWAKGKEHLLWLQVSVEADRSRYVRISYNTCRYNHKFSIYSWKLLKIICVQYGEPSMMLSSSSSDGTSFVAENDLWKKRAQILAILVDPSKGEWALNALQLKRKRNSNTQCSWPMQCHPNPNASMQRCMSP